MKSSTNVIKDLLRVSVHKRRTKRSPASIQKEYWHHMRYDKLDRRYHLTMDWMYKAKWEDITEKQKHEFVKLYRSMRHHQKIWQHHSYENYNNNGFSTKDLMSKRRFMKMLITHSKVS